MIKFFLIILVAAHLNAQYQSIYDIEYDDEAISEVRPPVPDRITSTTVRTTSMSSTTSTTTSTFASPTSSSAAEDPFADHDWSEWMEDPSEQDKDWEESLYASSSLENPWVLATVSLTGAFLALAVLAGTAIGCLCCCLCRSRRKATKAKKEMDRSRTHREWELGQLLSMGTARKEQHLRTRSEPFRPAMTFRRICDEEGLLPRVPALGYHPDISPLHRAGPGVQVVKTAEEAVKMLKDMGGARPKITPPAPPNSEAPSPTEEGKMSEAAALTPIHV
jgi:hypothetical protein